MGGHNREVEGMAKKMGKYCKAYYLSDFKRFPGWPGNLEYMRKEAAEEKSDGALRPLEDRDILYLQENYVVTDGIFLEEQIVFDKVTAEWIDFCTSTLAFKVPVFEK